MKKPILITLCCAGLMLVTPFTTIAQENKVTGNLSEQLDMDSLVAQIRVVIDEILQKYGQIPMVRNLCNVILNSLGLFGNIAICIFLIILLIPFALLLAVFLFIGILFYTINWIVIGILLTMGDYCTPYNSFISKLPFKSIYTLSETNDITNLAKNCPCLQE